MNSGIMKVKTNNHDEWKAIPGFEHLYEVSRTGQVRSLNRVEVLTSKSGQSYTRTQRGRLLKQYVNRYGYMKVILYKNSKPHYFTIHRLVATAFIDNPDHKNTVDHIDCDKTNNQVDNLRWVTTKENNLHSHKLGRQLRNSKPIIATSPTGEMFIFDSQREAARVTNMNQTSVWRCVNKKSVSVKGWSFEYGSHESAV